MLYIYLLIYTDALECYFFLFLYLFSLMLRYMR